MAPALGGWTAWGRYSLYGRLIWERGREKRSEGDGESERGREGGAVLRCMAGVSSSQFDPCLSETGLSIRNFDNPLVPEFKCRTSLVEIFSTSKTNKNVNEILQLLKSFLVQ